MLRMMQMKRKKVMQRDKKRENAHKDGLSEDLLDGDEAIDELDKANFSKHDNTKQNERTQSTVFCSDSGHENFIMECDVSGKGKSNISPVRVTSKGSPSVEHLAFSPAKTPTPLLSSLQR
jgi:hypothetical protein